MRKRWIVLLCLFSGAFNVGQYIAPASAAWKDFHWTKPRKAERVLLVIYSTRGSWTNRLAEAVGDWGISSDIDFVWQEGASNAASRKRCKLPKGNGQIRVCNYHYRWNDAARSELEVAHGRHILRGWVKLNNSATGDIRRSVVCHEFGHVLGLGHRSAKSSCMYNGLDSWPRTPDWDDYVAVYRRTHHHRQSSGRHEHEVETIRFRIPPRALPARSESSRRANLL